MALANLINCFSDLDLSESITELLLMRIKEKNINNEEEEIQK